MASIVIADLEMKRELHAHAMSNMVGGAGTGRDFLIGGPGNERGSVAGDRKLTAGSSETEQLALYSLFIVT